MEGAHSGSGRKQRRGGASPPTGAAHGGQPVPEEALLRQTPEADVLLLERQLFDSLAAAATDCAAYALDLEGLVVSWNFGAERLTGYGGAEVAGEHFSLFFRPADRRQHKPAWELKEAAEKGRVEYSGDSVRKDGSRFHAKVVTVARQGATGALKGFIRVIRDLTRVTGAEEGLQLFLAMWDRMPVGLLVVYREGAEGSQDYRILAANAAMVDAIQEPGLTVARLPGMAVANVLPRWFSREISVSLSAVMRAQQQRSLGQLRCLGAPPRVFSVQAFPLPGDCVGLVFVGSRREEVLNQDPGRQKSGSGL